MPPSLVEWLPEDHLVWTVLGAVEQMDLDRFREGYRLGGAGRPAYDPEMMVALLLYAYARGNRSSRLIERACLEDVAYKVITSMRVPDHSTIAEFRRRLSPRSLSCLSRCWGCARRLAWCRSG
jgi:transposase